VEAGPPFAVACGESLELLEAIEASFDAVAQFIECGVVVALQLPAAPGRDNGLRAHVWIEATMASES
jgi:hypothetical protein